MAASRSKSWLLKEIRAVLNEVGTNVAGVTAVAHVRYCGTQVNAAHSYFFLMAASRGRERPRSITTGWLFGRERQFRSRSLCYDYSRDFLTLRRRN
jgi:hypothetical protein